MNHSFKQGMLSDHRVIDFLSQHVEEMRSVSPPESKHALDVAALEADDIEFWTLWDGAILLATGALKFLDDKSVEIKSMRTSLQHRGHGLGRTMLNHLTQRAESKGFQTMYLETGTMAFFEPARRLYLSQGFIVCQPFASYKPDPNNMFMKKQLSSRS